MMRVNETMRVDQESRAFRPFSIMHHLVPLSCALGAMFLGGLWRGEKQHSMDLTPPKIRAVEELT